MTDAPRTAAAYIRVSTDEQVEQSPESQLVEIRKYAAQHGMILPDDQIYMDEGISGKRTENRPAFLRMIGAAKENPAPFDVILLWKFSRFARNQEESIVYKALLRKQCGVDVISVSEQLPDGPFASLIERIIEWFDEFYSIRLAQEVKRSMTVKAQKGELQATPPFGYRARIRHGEKTVLEPVPEEAVLVQEIFRRFVAGEGYYRIARWLNTQGITTHRGRPFENRTIEYIIRNPVYIGKLRWTPSGRVRRKYDPDETIVADAAHEPLVSCETFEAAQKQVALIKAAWGYKAKPSGVLNDWLSGAVRCADCGATLIFSHPHYFKCANYAKGRCRSSQHITAEALHAAVLQRMREDVQSSSLQYSVTQDSRTETGELPRLRAKLADLERRDGRLLDAYLGGAVDLQQFTGAKAALNSSREEVLARIAELEAQQAQKAESANLAERIWRTIDTLSSPTSTMEEKNVALRTVTESIIFDKSQMTLDIHYRVLL